MSKLLGSNIKMIKLNPEWSVENANSTPLEANVSIDDFSGKRLIITLPGAGGFCNKELDSVKENENKFKEVGVDEVIVIVGTDILTNAGRGMPNLLQDINMEFAETNKLKLAGVQSKYLNRAVIAVDSAGNEILREDSALLGCRTIDGMVDIAKKAFS